MLVVDGQDAVVADWAGRSLGVTFHQPYSALGIVEPDGLLKGAAIFGDFYPNGNIEWTHVGPGTLTRGVIRTLFKYAFEQCGATRITAKTKKSNRVVQKLLPRLGFKLESTIPRYYGIDKSDNALVFVLYRENAERWIGH